MAADIFRARQDREIHTHRDRLELKRRRPAVVEQGDDPLLVRDRANGRDVLDFEAVGARALHEDGARSVADQFREAGADQRIILTHGNAEADEKRITKCPGGAIDAVRDEQLIARAEDGEQRPRNRGRA